MTPAALRAAGGALRGTLEPSGLSGLLRLLGEARASGHLEVEGPGGPVTLRLWEGRIADARRPGAAGRAPVPADAAEVLAGLLEAAELGFSWSPGPAELPPGQQVLSVELALEEASRLARRGPEEPSGRSVPELVDRPGQPRVTLSEEEWRVLALVDGRRDVAEIAFLADLPLPQTVTLVSRLRDRNLVGLRPPGAPGRVFRVAVVCTGNRFRSPLVAGVLRSFAAGLPLEVESYGIEAPGGVPALPEALELARSLGVDISGHRTRPLEGARLHDVDLVLGFERMHVARAVAEAGAPTGRCFLLPEALAALRRAVAEIPAERDPVGRARALVERAGALKAVLGPQAAREVPDVVGRSRRAQARAARELRDATAELARLLFGLPVR